MPSAARIKAGSLEEVVLNPSGKEWVKYRPGRWVRVSKGMPSGGPCVCRYKGGNHGVRAWT